MRLIEKIHDYRPFVFISIAFALLFYALWFLQVAYKSPIITVGTVVFQIILIPGYMCLAFRFFMNHFVGNRYKKLADSERRFREIADLFPEMLCEADVHGKIVYANKAAFDTFGYTGADISNGLNMFDLLDPTEVQRARCNLKLRMQHPDYPKQEYLARKKNGETFPVLVHTSVIYKNNICNGYRGVMINISDRKHKEKELQVASTFTKKIIENTPIGIAVFDENHQNMLSNQMMDEIFEMDFKKFDRYDDEYDLIWVQSGIRNFIDQVFEKNRTIVLNTKFFNEYDETKWISVTGLPYDQGPVKQVLLLFSDISHQVQYENELKEMNMQMSTQNMIFLAQNEEIRRINKLLKEKEAGIRQKSAELELLIHNIDIQVWYLQEPGLYGAVNEAHADFIGKPLDLVMHRHITEVLTDEQTLVYQELYEKVFSGKKEVHEKKWLLAGNGKKRLIEIKMIPRLNSKTNKIEFVVCSGIDVTQQWLAEEKLTRNLQQQQHLSSISYAFNSLEDTMSVIHKALKEIGEHTGLNRIGVYEKTEGAESFICSAEWSVDDCLAIKNSRDHMSQPVYLSIFNVLEKSDEILADSKDDRIPDYKNFREFRKSQSLLILPLYVLNKMKGFICFEDTRKKHYWEQSEKELLKIVSNLISNSFSKKKILDELTSSEKKFRSLYEHMDEAFFIISEKRITDCNKATLMLFNLNEKSELLNKPVTSISPEIQSDGISSLELTLVYYQKALEQGSCRFEWIFCKTTGQTFHAEVTLTSVEIGGKQVFYAICHDIEELKRYQQELKEAKNTAEKANNLKSQFLANVSHEIRTPMNAILGYARILSNRGLTGVQNDYVKIIHESGQNLLALLNDILDLSKIEAGKMTIEHKPLLLKALLDEIRNIFRLKTSQKSIEFITCFDPALPDSLVLDQTRLRQILFNLVGNAVKFTESGFVKLSVSLLRKVVSKEKVDLQLIVEDTGIGIRKDQLGEIFNTFQQQPGQNRKFGGTGLGLAITKKLVEMMGGNIIVESKVGVGSLFKVNFYHIPVHADYIPPDDERIHTGDIKFNEELILVAEDNPINANLVKTMLEDRGLKVLLAEHGRDALNQLSYKRPKAIIMDIKMPLMDGFEAISVLKSHPVLKQIPVIAMSAQAMKEDEERIMKSGCEAFIPKPVNEDLLVIKLAEYLGKGTINPREKMDNQNLVIERLTDYVDKVVLGQELISKLYEQWQRNSESMQLDQWKCFGEKIKEIGFKYEIEPFKELGDEFLESIQYYDIKRLKQTINKYPKLPGVLPL